MVQIRGYFTCWNGRDLKKGVYVILGLQLVSEDAMLAAKGREKRNKNREEER